MSKKKGPQKRLVLFDRGNTRCPICLKRFTRDAVEEGLDVTLEHAPPKALGGLARCLTCTDCNSSAGRNIDQAAAMINSAIRDREAGRGIKVELDLFGTKHTTYFSPDGAARSGPISRLASSPSTAPLRSQLKGQRVLMLTEITRGPVWDASRGITLTTNQPPQRHVVVSWLRSAYLLVFSLLGQKGYQWVGSDAIQLIREQIMKPDDELVLCLLCEISPLPPPKDLIIMNNRHQPFCWIVKIGNMGVLLPHGGTARHYEEVAELPDQINIGRAWSGWKPTEFGKYFSVERTLRADSDHAGRDLFGSEFTVTEGERERRCIVVEQHELDCTIMPFGPVTRRAA